MSKLFLYVWLNSEDASAVSICLAEIWGCLSCFYMFGRNLGMSKLGHGTDQIRLVNLDNPMYLVGDMRLARNTWVGVQPRISGG